MTNLRSAIRFFGLCVLILTQSSCHQGASRDTIDAGLIVARWGDQFIFLAEVERELQAQPDYIRARYDTPERKRELARQYVRNRLLVQEAKRRGLEKSQEVVSVVERALIQQLIHEETKGIPAGDEPQKPSAERAAKIEALLQSLTEKSNVTIDEQVAEQLDAGVPSGPLLP